MIGRKEVEQCIGFNPIKDDEDYGYIVAIDVGGGDFRDDSVMTVARVVGSGMYGENARKVYIEALPILDNTQNTVAFSRQAHRLSLNYSNVTLAVDKGGMGVAFIHQLEELGASNIYKVTWGNPCFKRENKDQFCNLRTQAIVSLARAIQDGRFGISESVAYEHRARIINELTRIPYDYDSRARYQVMSKPDMKAKGIPSPDVADTFAFCFLEDIFYTATDTKNDQQKFDLNQEMQSKFAGLDDFLTT